MTDRTNYRGRRPQNGAELVRLKAHWEGVPDSVIEAARLGNNRSCVGCFKPSLDGGLRCLDCFRPSLYGGLRCLNCFGKVASPASSVGGCGTDAGYTAHLRSGVTPCGACREAHSKAQALRKRRAA